MELLLIRHARPERRETTDGSPADPPLSHEGREQAERLVHWLAPEPIDRIYTSPMRRARETATPLGDARGLALEVDPRIAEFDQHSSVYVPLEELKRTDYERWRAFVQGGYEDGVDLRAFQSGVIAAMEEIIAANRGGRVAVVCHGGVINIWAAHVLGFEPRLFFDAGYTSVNRFIAASSGERSLHGLNEQPRP